MQESVISLFNGLAKQFGKSTVLYYIQEQTDIAPIVVEEWMAGERSPSSGIQKAIFKCLQDARPDGFPQEHGPLRIPVKKESARPQRIDH